MTLASKKITIAAITIPCPESAQQSHYYLHPSDEKSIFLHPACQHTHQEMEQLSPGQIDQFITEGFIKVEHAFPTELADKCRSILWKATQCDPDDPGTWTQPVIRIPELSHEAFKRAANTPVLHNAFDQLTGSNWIPRTTLGSFPIRFPGKEPATDTGWHVDASFPGEDPHNYFIWRINIRSKGRALLMLFLFSDVSATDAPTIIKVGSHSGVAKILEPEGDKGLSAIELAQKLHELPACNEALATGKAGTVYLCHPFVVHAAQDHRGSTPRFLAQPPLMAKRDFVFSRSGSTPSPVEKAILNAIR